MSVTVITPLQWMHTVHLRYDMAVLSLSHTHTHTHTHTFTHTHTHTHTPIHTHYKQNAVLNTALIIALYCKKKTIPFTPHLIHLMRLTPSAAPSWCYTGDALRVC